MLRGYGQIFLWKEPYVPGFIKQTVLAANKKGSIDPTRRLIHYFVDRGGFGWE